MDEQRRNAILAKAYNFLETPIERHVSPQTSWQPRHAEPEPIPERKTASGHVDMYQRIDRVWQHHLQHKSATANMLDELADLCGAETGKLQKQLDELQKQVEALRGELSLIRAQANRPQKASTRSRAPFKLDDENVSFRSN